MLSPFSTIKRICSREQRVASGNAFCNDFLRSVFRFYWSIIILSFKSYELSKLTNCDAAERHETHGTHVRHKHLAKSWMRDDQWTQMRLLKRLIWVHWGWPPGSFGIILVTEESEGSQDFNEQWFFWKSQLWMQDNLESDHMQPKFAW